MLSKGKIYIKNFLVIGLNNAHTLTAEVEEEKQQEGNDEDEIENFVLGFRGDLFSQFSKKERQEKILTLKAALEDEDIPISSDQNLITIAAKAGLLISLFALLERMSRVLSISDIRIVANTIQVLLDASSENVEQLTRVI